jgi:hypothetical protein
LTAGRRSNGARRGFVLRLLLMLEMLKPASAISEPGTTTTARQILP